MGRFWDFLLANPILFFILAAWIAGGIGNVLKSKGAARRREERDRQRTSHPAPSRPESPPSVSRPTPSAMRPVEPKRSGPPPLSMDSGRQEPDAVAAEMRRILGLDDVEVVRPSPTPARAPEVMPRSEPIVRQRSRPLAEQPMPMTPEAATRMLERRIDPHVGEGITHRKTPRSRVGEHDSDWGSLGGRRPADSVTSVASERVTRLVDLADIKRVILGAEILGPPLALRDPGQERLI